MRGVRGVRVWVYDTDAVSPIHVDPTTFTAAWTATGATTYTMFGKAVAGAGDVNGDGLSDVIAGGYYYGSMMGYVAVYNGILDGDDDYLGATEAYRVPAGLPPAS